MNTYYPIRGFGDVSAMMRDHVMARARHSVGRRNIILNGPSRPLTPR